MTTALLESAEGKEWPQTIDHDQSTGKLYGRAEIQTRNHWICRKTHCRLRYGFRQRFCYLKVNVCKQIWEACRKLFIYYMVNIFCGKWTLSLIITYFNATKAQNNIIMYVIKSWFTNTTIRFVFLLKTEKRLNLYVFVFYHNKALTLVHFLYLHARWTVTNVYY